jgi:transcriptional regulator with XRE-family HTH domain
MKNAGIDNQAELARRVGCTRQAISKWLKGDPFTDGVTLFLLSRELRVAPRWLLMNEGSPSPMHDPADDEARLLIAFRNMSPPERTAVLQLSEALSGSSSSHKVNDAKE